MCIRDRSKHPAVSLAAVVAKPDEKWGETPCAFVELIEGKSRQRRKLLLFVEKLSLGLNFQRK